MSVSLRGVRGSGGLASSFRSRSGSLLRTYGLDNLHLTVAKGYVRSLLANGRIVQWITRHRGEYLAELQAIAEIDTVAPMPEAAE